MLHPQTSVICPTIEQRLRQRDPEVMQRLDTLLPAVSWRTGRILRYLWDQHEWELAQAFVDLLRGYNEDFLARGGFTRSERQRLYERLAYYQSPRHG